MEKVLVLIGDVEDSQSIPPKDREVLQQNLADVLEGINDAMSDCITSPYTITLGDEFQAVFSDAMPVFEHIITIMARLHPVQVRFSLGVGPLDTPINKEQAIGMDGPAFHVARKGIDYLKENEELFHISIVDDNSTELKIINSSLQLISGQMRSWNKRRLTILEMIKQGYDYKEISEAVGISKPAFYKNKEAGMLDVIDDMSDNIASFLNQYITK
ncbi:SatD family protein [Fodinibius sp. Rm-B-1B1-1]|uniref:SatD family protein n=1 Tax=Fodinibius alkaliphilus TaxID=3140241 RepID=UPI003159C967